MSRRRDRDRPWIVRRGVLLGALLVLCLSARGSDAVVSLWRPTTLPPGYSPSQRTIASRAVTIDVARLRPGGDSLLTIVLPDSTARTLERRRVEVTGAQRSVWVGRVAGDSTSRVTIAVVKRRVSGSITTAGRKAYRLHSLTDSTAVIEEIDPKMFGEGAEPIGASSTGTPPKLGLDTCSDDPTQIDLMVLYNATARASAGLAEDIEAAIDQAVSETNQSYEDSDVDQRLRLVHVGEILHDEPVALADDRTRLGDDTDALFIEVSKLRDEFAADVVALVGEYGGGIAECGASYVMETVAHDFERYAYSVIARDCLISPDYKMGHELGHLMSARHDWGSDPTSGVPYAFNHGHIEKVSATVTSAWRTIMSLGSPCSSCEIKPIWSNPALSIDGEPAGLSGGAKPEDNHQVLNLTAPTVANFRCSTTFPAQPWMKDTWADSGEEPDPDTAAEDMWKSPYIWVRNAADPGHEHMHEHENPIWNQPNYAYVKIHNGEAAGATGDLEIWTAAASSGLGWPGSWTRVGTQSVTFAASRATRIVEFVWTPTVEGHVCMIARWVSAADPMTYPEGPDVEPNVRNNNNLVWRNLNIVDLTMASTMSAFSMENPGAKEGVFTLEVRPFRRKGDPPGIRAEALALRPTGRTPAHWRDRLRLFGFRWREGALVLTDPRGGRIEGIRLPRRSKLPMQLLLDHRVVPSRAGLVATKGIDVVQRSGRGPLGRVIGGVSYEFRGARKGR
jgi:hypothetical protein